MSEPLPFASVRIAVLSICVFSAGAASAQFQGPAINTPLPEHVVSNGSGNVPAGGVREMPSYRPVYILAGDVLEIDILGLTSPVPSSSNATTGTSTATGGGLHPTVQADGLVTVPYIGAIKVDGLTTLQVANLISTRLAEGGFIKDAQVQVGVLTAPSQVVSVQGEVKTPNVFPVAGERTLLGMLAAAGGLMPTASHLITVVRHGSGETLQVSIDPNPARGGSIDIPIYPGDSILVSKAGEIYVVGAVKTQSAFPIATNTPLTVIQAITLAGGANFEAGLSQTRIIRTEGATRKEITLDMKKILHGTEPDPILQADDIVFVPSNTFKGAIKGGATQTALGLVTAAALFVR